MRQIWASQIYHQKRSAILQVGLFVTDIFNLHHANTNVTQKFSLQRKDKQADN